MKVVLALCVALLCVILVQAEEEMSPPIRRGGNRIHHGTPATPTQLPYMANIWSTKDSGSVWGCCGSLITRKAVLAAAFCVDGIQHNNGDRDFPVSSGSFTKYTVRLGSIYRILDDKNAWTTESTWALMHPEYNHTTWDNNVAIIYLPREAPLNDFIQPVELASPDAGSFIGSRGIVSGWGYTYPGSGFSDVLLWAELDVIPNDICREVYYTLPVSDRHLCAGTFTSTAGSGDQGAPLVITTGERHIQVGVFFCCTDTYNTSTPILFTRVSSFSDWIKLKTESVQ